jgi:hypothetical protein
MITAESITDDQIRALRAELVSEIARGEISADPEVRQVVYKDTHP